MGNHGTRGTNGNMCTVTFIRRVGTEIEMQCEDCSRLWRRPASTNGGPTPQRCLDCKVARRREQERAIYASKNAEKMRERNERIAWRKANWSEVRRGYREQVHRKEAIEAYRARPDVKAREKARRQSAEHRERQRQYRLNSPDYVDRQTAAQERYRQTDHARVHWREAVRKRRAMLAQADVRTIAPKDARRLREARNCYYCGKTSSNMHVDHVIPVKEGGGERIGNLVPACHRCNQGAGKGKYFLAVARYRRGFQVQWSTFTPGNIRETA